MLTRQITAEEMEQHVARFKALEPNKDEYVERIGIPVAAYEYVAAKNIYYMQGEVQDDVGGNSRPALAGDAGTSIFIVDCPPGDGPTLHAHMNTRESFMPLTGPFEIIFGDTGEHSLVLDPLDMIAVPPGVTRAFKNIGPRDAQMLAVVQGAPGEAMNDIQLTPAIAAEIAAQWGQEAVAGLERLGMTFRAGLAE
jgi:uncharacterized RmlC-like cupin family protein